MLDARDLANITSKLSKILIAVVMKKSGENLAEKLRDERFQRTPTDEYPFARKPRPSPPISAEQREHHAKMARLRGWA